MIPDESSWGALMRHMSTSSAVNPTMVVSIAAMLVGFLGLQFGPEDAFYVFSGLIIMPMLVFLWQVIYFSVYDRDRLQNDKHVEQKMMINKQILGTRDGGEAKLMLLPENDDRVVNPTFENRSAASE